MLPVRAQRRAQQGGRKDAERISVRHQHDVPAAVLRLEPSNQPCRAVRHVLHALAALPWRPGLQPEENMTIGGTRSQGRWLGAMPWREQEQGREESSGHCLAGQAQPLGTQPSTACRRWAAPGHGLLKNFCNCAAAQHAAPSIWMHTAYPTVPGTPPPLAAAHLFAVDAPSCSHTRS